MPEMQSLRAEITRNREVDESAVLLINGIAARIEAAKTNPVELQALADELRSSSDNLAAAVIANTPSAPPA